MRLGEESVIAEGTPTQLFLPVQYQGVLPKTTTCSAAATSNRIVRTPRQVHRNLCRYGVLRLRRNFTSWSSCCAQD